MQALVHGVFSALLTPRHPDGSLNQQVLRKQATFLLAAGVDGLVMFGATGEYSLARDGEFAEILAVVSEVAGPRRFIAGLGGGAIATAVHHGRLAAEAGALALLLPAPHFFRYSQEDLQTYAHEVTSAVDAPVLLYNLPQFTNGFDVETAGRLVQAGGRVVGMKDSSGSLDILQMLTARGASGISRIVGNDQVFAQARREGVCDGVISGVAAALPELLVFLARTCPVRDPEAFQEAAALLEVVLKQLAPFPTPWGLKRIAERRGLGPLGSPLPMSSSRRAQADALASWLDDWWPELCAVVPAIPLPAAEGVV